MKRFGDFYGYRQRPILPSTGYHAGKDNATKVSISDIGNRQKEEMKYFYPNGGEHKSTIQICHQVDKRGRNKDNKTRLRFIVGAGHTPHKDESFPTKHDQTWANLGQHKVVNTVHLTNGEIVHAHNDLHLDAKAPSAVYK